MPGLISMHEHIQANESLEKLSTTMYWDELAVKAFIRAQSLFAMGFTTVRFARQSLPVLWYPVSVARRKNTHYRPKNEFA
jgi:hypothetical protein